MKTFRYVLTLVVLVSGSLFSQTDPVLKFTARQFMFQGQWFPYRLFIPENYQPTNRYPLLLALHGSGERGTDNVSQLRANQMATAWVNPAVQAKSACFIVAPQCPPNLDWGNEIGALAGLLDSLGREFSLDSNRIYITGLSMGGYGTWQMITNYPQRFAAAIPMSGGWDSSLAYIVKNIAMWDFHGAVDPTVPVSESRNMITALENLGRKAIHTNCHAFDCTGMPDSLVAMYVRSHADLLYTEYQGGGHVIWDQAYTTPLLSTWLFGQYRQIPSAIELSNLSAYRSLSGLQQIQWTGGTTDDSVEIWESPDAGSHWQLVTRAAPNSGSYAWNTAGAPDCAFGLINVFLKNHQGWIYGHDQSAYFTIDNPGNGQPFVELSTPGVEPGQTLTGDSLALRILVGDPEDSSLTLRVLYSVDGGRSFAVADSFPSNPDTLPTIRKLNIGRLANSDYSILAVEASDRSLTGRSGLPPFSKQTPRGQGPSASRTTGSGGSITVHIVDPSQLTGHLYRVTFQGVTFGSKTYDVTDLDLGRTVLQGGFPLDGRTEGPMLDGVRLVVRDEETAELDAIGTKWEVAAPTIIHVAVHLPTIILETGTIQGYAQASDYALTVADHVVDTSSAAIAGLPEIPVNFSVTNLTENRRLKFIYMDADNNGMISGNDEVYFLELDSLSNLRVTWELQFLLQSGGSLPQPGDRYALRTIKPISVEDVYEFRTTSTSVQTDTRPLQSVLFANYPNPFNPVTVIRYTVGGTRGEGRGAGEAGAGGSRLGTRKTRLVVYDVLGRQVAVLVDEPKAPGSYEVSFNGRLLASGVYFYRLTAGGFVETKKMLLVK